jgi:dihydroxyacetone kinase-like predicted kinase
MPSPAREVVVLPNSGNVLMAAERAAEISEKTVRVVPSRSLQAGLSAALAADPGKSAADNVAAMSAALAGVRAGAVTAAARDDGDGRFRAGEAVGFVDERLVAWGTPEQALVAVVRELADDGTEVVSCIAGDGAPLDEDEVPRWCPTGSTSSTPWAASRTGGGCSRPSDPAARGAGLSDPRSAEPGAIGRRPVAPA